MSKNTQKALLDAALPHVPFDGWSNELFAKASADAGIDVLTAKRIFPRGIADMVDYFCLTADEAMLKDAGELGSMRIRDRVTHLVRTRLEGYMSEHSEAARATTKFLANPLHAPDALKILNRTVDTMWRAAGDTSTDYNYYTKRALLRVVYSSTLLYWLNDSSDNKQNTWDFLDDRIENVMQIGKAIHNVQGSLKEAWNSIANHLPKHGAR